MAAPPNTTITEKKPATTAAVTNGALSSLAAAIKTEARRLGFDLVGIAPAVTPTGFSMLQEWLRRGYAGRRRVKPPGQARR